MQCSVCAKPEADVTGKLLLCSKCKTAAYCCKKCQRSDAKSHKKVCGLLNKGIGSNDAVAQANHSSTLAKTKEIAAGFEDRSPAHRKIWKLFENKANKSEAAVIRDMQKVFLHIPRPELVELMLALLPKLVCAPTKMIRKPTSPLAVLLDSEQVDPNAVSSEEHDGQTALLFLAECSAGDLTSMENQVVLARQLLDAGANVNKRAGAARLYPLHTALHSDNVTNLDYIQLLLERGADPNAQNIKGETPLMHAMPRAHQAAKFVVEYYSYEGGGATNAAAASLDLNVRAPKGGTLLGLVRSTIDTHQRWLDELLMASNANNDGGDRQAHLENALEQLVDFENLLEEREAVCEEWMGPVAQLQEIDVNWM